MKPSVPLPAVLLILVCSCRALYAQSPDNDAAALPGAFISVGIAAETTDEGSRMRLFDEASSLVWLIEGSAALSRRFGLGIEFAQPSAVSATTSGRSFHESGRQVERLLVGLFRARVVGFKHGAVDVVTGGGVLFQHHERQFAPCSSGCEDTLDETLDHRAPALAIGTDVLIHVTRHLQVSAPARIYALRRGEHTTKGTVLIPWPYEWKSSTRVSVGATARVTW
jgi:hypothetical protein